MGLGVMLVTSRSEADLDAWLVEMHRDASVIQTLRLPSTANGGLLTLVTGDCGLQWICEPCGRLRCVGCGHTVVLHLDWDRPICQACNFGLDVWETIRFLYDLLPDPRDP